MGPCRMIPMHNIVWGNYILESIPDKKRDFLYKFCLNLYFSLLFGNFKAFSSCSANNKHSFVLIFTHEVLHRRVRQNNCFWINLLKINVFCCLVNKKNNTLTPTISLICSAFSSSVTPPPLVNKTNGTFLIDLFLVKGFLYGLYNSLLLLPISSIVTIK